MQNNPKTFSREQFVHELKLRESIRYIIKDIYQEKQELKRQTALQENLLRTQIKKLLKEIVVNDNIPYQSTGINVLEELLKRIIPNLEIGYKQLTSSSEQRNSFRAHIVNAVQNILIPDDIEIQQNELNPQNKDTAVSKKLQKKSKDMIDGAKEVDEAVDVAVGDEGAVGLDPESVDPSNFIDIEKSQRNKKMKDVFTIDVMDMTGRNVALKTFEKIEKNIIDAYSLLSDEKDRDLFSEYLIANIKLYCDRWEDELSFTLQEPTNPAYENSKNAEIKEKI